ncbi:MAG: hypothetical protein EOP33_00535 [Rickettsiaceae bacterium]|nr:MAG: hypothetical protein EOP33_00535 [Rickettsiaceae bacterium]
MIPGSGEYVYDTKVQYKTNNGAESNQEVINSHNHFNIANSVHSLNQMLQICENIEWVSPVVCWFGDNIDASICKIKSAVEFNNNNVTYSEEWQVSHYRRSSAKLISKDTEGNPKYGGTVNDNSVLRYLEELKNRNLNVMFYPMCFLDIEGKPWRGHLTSDARGIERFFNQDEGYNNFIIHYANLVKNHVDAFVIGSEFIGLTAVREGDRYPAVDELVKLATIVKSIMGTRVLVTYAADWSEYHHTHGGWYNLDPLWSSPNIDFIGIDAYFPVTRSTTSTIITTDIEQGWQSGEGYDYYYDHTGAKMPLDAPYAWKNVKYWWENFHQNPDGNNSPWQPRMKKIWFTEFGFPSIDKATNQPNVFFDPHCRDGGIPKYSTGEVDFSIQRRAIKSFINYWENQEYIERCFLWTWDARPYPAWPHLNIWADEYLWEKGYWVNNKFGAANVAAIILELSNRCGISYEKLDVSDLDQSIEGIVFDRCMSANDAINIVRVNSFFDIKTTQGNKISFVKRGLRIPYDIKSDMLIKFKDNSYLEIIEISRKSIISKIHINYIDRLNNYKQEYCQIDSEHSSNKIAKRIALPISFSKSEITRLGNLILDNAAIEDKVIKFEIPITYYGLSPTDVINIRYKNHSYQIRLIAIEICNFSLKINGVIDNFDSYNLPIAKDYNLHTPTQAGQTKLKIIELPFLFNNHQDSLPCIHVYLSNNIAKKLYVSVNQVTNSAYTYNKIANLRPGAVIGKLINIECNQRPNPLLIDLTSIIIVNCDLSQLITSQWNLALLGQEIIKFRTIKSLGNHHYQITEIMRGLGATEQHINAHVNDEDFIILDVKQNKVGISQRLENQSMTFSINKQGPGKIFSFQNLAKYLPPVFIKELIHQEEAVIINWQLRIGQSDIWNDEYSNDCYSYIIKLYYLDQLHTINSSKQEVNIKYQELGINGDFNICIIAQRSDGITSIPAKSKIQFNS